MYLRFLLVLLVGAGCASVSDRPAPASPGSAANGAPRGETATFVPTGPQSYTPPAKPELRENAVRQLWSTPIGRTDERTSLMFADGAVWVGAKPGKLGPGGIYVIDGDTGARRALLPGAQGEIVGIALDGTQVYSTSLEGELALTKNTGAVVFRTRAPAPIVTPPTLVDVDGDGTLEVAVGDGRGNVTLFDGKTGKTRWTRALGGTIGIGLAAADLDGDRKPEIVAGTDAGALVALHGDSGAPVWQVKRSSPFRAAPVLCDVDANGKLEVIAGAYEGELVIVAGATGRELWSQKVEEDNGEKTGIVASPTPLPGGTLLVPTARHGKDDSILFVRAHDRAYRAHEGSVFASPVDGIVGTERGEVFSFDASGTSTYFYRLEEGSIAAPALIADLGQTGVRELVVATREGKLIALSIHVAAPPLSGTARGASRHNDGVLPPIDLGWRL